MYQILALSSLCTITRYQNERFRHHFTKNFPLLRIRCSDNCSNIAVGISHTFASPLCYLFTNQFIQRTTVDQTILELSAGWIGGLYENKDSFLFFFAYIHKRLDTIGSQIWIYCSKILIKTGICFACDLYFSEMSGRINTSSVADLINLAQNLDCFEFYPGVEDDETLGRIYVEDMEAIDVPEHLLNYFDYEAYGRDIRLEEDGHFAPGGYVLNNGGQFIEHYHGIEDIPAEHKVFAFPQLTVREQMAAYKEIIDGSSLEGYRKIAAKEHEER